MEWIILGVLCAIATSLIIVISKTKMYDHESIEYATSVRVIAFFFTLPLIAYYFLKIKTISQYEVILIYVGSLLNTIAYWLTFKSVKHIDIDKISPFLNLEVVFVFLFGYLFFLEMPSTLGIIGISLILISILAIEYKTKVNFRSFIRNPNILKYTTIIFLSTLYYALFKILSRYVLHYQQINFIEFIVLLNIFNAFNSILLVSLVEHTTPITFFKKLFVKDITSIGVGLLTLIQILTEYSAYSLTTNSAYVSAIKMLYVIFSIFIAQIVYKEKYSKDIYAISSISLLGAILIIVGR